MKLFAIIFLFLIVILPSGYSQFSDQLSKKTEEVLFSFKLSNGKVASLCKDKQNKYLVYRFGKADKLELEFPKTLDSTSWREFKLSGAKRFGGKANAGFGDYSISFVNSGIKYAIFESWNDEDDSKQIGMKLTISGKESLVKGLNKSQIGSLLKFDDESDRIKNSASENQ